MLKWCSAHILAKFYSDRVNDMQGKPLTFRICYPVNVVEKLRNHQSLTYNENNSLSIQNDTD